MHPWITGKDGAVPMTIDEMYKGLETQQKMAKLFKVLILLGQMKKVQNQLKPLSESYI
jgi:hypothetical protein